jgi:hypothetical protein
LPFTNADVATRGSFPARLPDLLIPRGEGWTPTVWSSTYPALPPARAGPARGRKPRTSCRRPAPGWWRAHVCCAGEGSAARGRASWATCCGCLATPSSDRLRRPRGGLPRTAKRSWQRALDRPAVDLRIEFFRSPHGFTARIWALAKGRTTASGTGTECCLPAKGASASAAASAAPDDEERRCLVLTPKPARSGSIRDENNRPKVADLQRL